MWNPSKHTDDENLRWCWLRAVEWDAWPFFLSQPLVPVLLYSFTWWKIIVVLALIQFIWTTWVRTKFISVWLADLGVLVVQLKWIACPIFAYMLFEQGRIELAALALLWPLAMFPIKHVLWIAMVLVLTPFKVELLQIGVMQRLFMGKFGYSPRQESD